MIKVLIVDDQSLIREGLSMMLSLYDTIDIVGEVKHEKAEIINIDIKTENNNINISVKDNGLGCCSNLVKGNGLIVIESRINGINGKINYDSMDQGFSIQIII